MVRIHMPFTRFLSWLPALVAALVIAGCGSPESPTDGAQTSTGGTGGPDAISATSAPVLADLAAATLSGSFVRQHATADTPAHVLMHDGEGTGSSRIQLDLELPAAGDYHIWLRAKWRDTCGNSCLLQVPGLPPIIVGEDAVYDTWHWVKAGPLPLPAGAQTLTLQEREDGVALDQILLTRDAEYRPPSARIAPTAAGDEPGTLTPVGPPIPDRVFADDFNRSPGHGLGDWRAESGDWALTFSFDPNRIPQQYAISGASTDAAPDARLSIDGDPWLTCHLSFAVMPHTAQTVGAVLDLGEQPPVEARLDLQRQAIVIVHGERQESLPVPDALRPGQWHHLEIRRERDQVTLVLDRQWTLRATGIPAQPGRVALLAAGGQAIFDDVRAASGSYTGHGAPPYVVGPYDFQSNQLEDPSDYLDFTDEEIAAMEASGDFDKLERKPRSMAVIGPGANEKSAWRYHHGSWTIADGVLTGQGPSSSLAHVGGFDAGLELRTRIRLLAPRSLATVSLYGPDPPLKPAGPPAWDRRGRPRPKADPLMPPLIPDGGQLAWITGGPAPTAHTPADPAPGDAIPPSPPALTIPAITDDAWHDLRLVSSDGTLHAWLDGTHVGEYSTPRGFGTTLRLGVQRGTVQFDNLEIRQRRLTPTDRVYTFDQRETDWWRQGHWTDHSGIACVLASNWTSLIVPDGSGYLRQKRPVGTRVRLSAHIEEYSEWYGWKAKPSHQHFPFDHVQLGLADTAGDPVYLLTVNAENHDTAILTRRGQEVARIQQPLHLVKHRGGHSPYHPRRLHLILDRQDGQLIARLNGAELLRWTDPEPLDAPIVIIGGHHTRFNVARIEIHDTLQH